MKKELFLFVFLSIFITLIDLGAQIRGAQTQYTVVNFGLNQPLNVRDVFLSVTCYRKQFQVQLTLLSFLNQEVNSGSSSHIS